MIFVLLLWIFVPQQEVYALQTVQKAKSLVYAILPSEKGFSDAQSSGKRRLSRKQLLAAILPENRRRPQDQICESSFTFFCDEHVSCLSPLIEETRIGVQDAARVCGLLMICAYFACNICILLLSFLPLYLLLVYAVLPLLLWRAVILNEYKVQIAICTVAKTPSWRIFQPL